jgi:exodeoxyribonuclease VII small subunit
MVNKEATNYQKMSEELNTIIEWFESEEADLDEAISKYETAVKLLDDMQTYLKTAENKIHQIQLNQ